MSGGSQQGRSARLTGQRRETFRGRPLIKGSRAQGPDGKIVITGKMNAPVSRDFSSVVGPRTDRIEEAEGLSGLTKNSPIASRARPAVISGRWMTSDFSQTVLRLYPRSSER
jgi:hypothetical protein